MPSLSIYSFILLNEHTAVIQCFPSHPPSFSLLVYLLGGSFNLLRSLLCFFNNAFCLKISVAYRESPAVWAPGVCLCFIASQAMSLDMFIFSSSGHDLICCAAWLFSPRTSWVLLYESTQLRWGIISTHPPPSDFPKTCLYLPPRCPVTQQGSKQPLLHSRDLICLFTPLNYQHYP